MIPSAYMETLVAPRKGFHLQNLKATQTCPWLAGQVAQEMPEM